VSCFDRHVLNEEGKKGVNKERETDDVAKELKIKAWGKLFKFELEIPFY